MFAVNSGVERSVKYRSQIEWCTPDNKEKVLVSSQPEKMSLVFSDVHTSYSSRNVYNTIKLIKKQCRYFSQVWILRDLGERQKTAYGTLFENKGKELFVNSVESNTAYLASWWMFRFWHFSANLLSANAKLLEFKSDSALII